MENVDMLIDSVNSLVADLVKFYEKGNKAAGTRARIKAHEMKKLLTTIRTDIQTIKKEK